MKIILVKEIYFVFIFEIGILIIKRENARAEIRTQTCGLKIII